MPKERITAERLREVLRYDPATGFFVWLVRKSQGVRAGDVAGSTVTNGYKAVYIDGRLYLSHRLAFLYMEGEWPNTDIDHKDGNPGNNSWDNLRKATEAQNSRNRKLCKKNTSGLKGASWHKGSKTWNATIRLNGKNKHLGQFSTKEQAHAAYVNAAKLHFGEFARVA